MATKKRVITVVVSVIIVCALCVGGFLLYKKFGGGGTNSSEKVFVQKVSSINTVTGADLFSNSFAGVIVAQQSVDVKYDTSKTVDEILVSDGDTVKKGDKLLTYDVEAIQLEIDTAQLEVERLENSIKTNETEIASLENEKKNASEDAAVSYTTQILSLQSDNARDEYDIKAKNVEIQKLEASLKSAYVTAPIDGTVTNLQEVGSEDEYSDSSDVIMQISADGDYRVKGIFNEQNSSNIAVGVSVILKSRVDDTQWSGEISEIDTNPQSSTSDMYSYYESDESTTSSKYAFYVEPESLDGFMLGQHIIIEIDNGQSTEKSKTGIWIYSDFILKDGNKSYVWAKDDNDKIEKRYIEIGETDEDYGDCEILSGLESDDYIAYPADYIKSGMSTTTNQSDKDIPDNDLTEDDEYYDEYYDDEYYDDEYYDDEYYDDYEDGEYYEEVDCEEDNARTDIDITDILPSDDSDISVEEMFGISEEELTAMSDDELREFLSDFYASQDSEEN